MSRQPLSLETIDWHQPWMRALQPVAEPLIETSDWHAALNAAARRGALCNHRGLPLQFVAQSLLPDRVAYESFISDTGQIPTRDNLHDFFNGLIWLTYPRAKAQLNALQASEIARAGPTGQLTGRGAARDAATLFDENAALVIIRVDDRDQSAEAGSDRLGSMADDPTSRTRALAEALRCHAWQEAFINRRDLFERDVSVGLFGHALIEKLIRPYKAITAHALILEAGSAFFDADDAARRRWIDRALADRIANQGAAGLRFTPLPVLGVPGWHAQQDAAFYADTSVFRPKRRAVTKGE